MSAGLRYRTLVPAIGGLLAGHLSATAMVATGCAVVTPWWAWVPGECCVLGQRRRWR
jgi:hypothetical protein